MASSIVLLSLVLLWQSWYYHNAIYHLYDEDRNTWMITIQTQLHDINRVDK